MKTIPIHEHLRPRLCDTYENDSIFDKFEVVFSGDAKNVMTGSYNNNFMIYPSDPDKEVEVVLQADKSAFKAKKVGVPTPINSSTSPTATNGGKKGSSRAGSPAAGASGQGGRMRKETDADQIDFNKKILHMSWHPFEDSIAIAATNNVSHFASYWMMLTHTSFSSSRHCRLFVPRERGLLVIISAFINGQHYQIHDSRLTNLVRALGIVDYEKRTSITVVEMPQIIWERFWLGKPWVGAVVLIKQRSSLYCTLLNVRRNYFLKS